MKRTFTLILATLAAIVLFAGLVHLVLVGARVSDPAATTVYGLTTDRVWATLSVGLALLGALIGGAALVRSAKGSGPGQGRNGAIVAFVVGLVAVVIGGLLLLTADGGPGSGNGVVGAAMSLVLGLTALAESGLTLARSRRTQ
ncbi:MAG: DUF6223 family protein [Caldilineaceae bacterium]